MSRPSGCTAATPAADRHSGKLRDLGNTIVVVEHDPDVMRAADHIVDLGPGAGELGGQSFAKVPTQRLLQDGEFADVALSCVASLQIRMSPRGASRARERMVRFRARGRTI